MVQEMAASITAPRAWLIYAWVDVALHPKFPTYQRWFPLMKTRWRRISLAVTLALIVVNSFFWTTLVRLGNENSIQTLNLNHMFALISSSGALFQFSYGIGGSIVALYAMPAAVTLVSARSLGPYRIRFKRAFRPWIQTQPAICAHLLLSGLVVLVFALLGQELPSSGIVSEVFAIVAFALVFSLPARSWMLSYRALAAGSGRTTILAGFAAAIPGLLVWILPSLLGHPIL